MFKTFNTLYLEIEKMLNKICLKHVQICRYIYVFIIKQITLTNQVINLKSNIPTY